MADHEVNTRDVMMSRTIFGSPATVRDKILALRAEAGPFCNLLMSGMDWSGPNEAWERESIELMAKEVWPAVRRQIEARDGAAAAVSAQ